MTSDVNNSTIDTQGQQIQNIDASQNPNGAYDTQENSGQNANSQDQGNGENS